MHCIIMHYFLYWDFNMLPKSNVAYMIPLRNNFIIAAVTGLLGAEG